MVARRLGPSEDGTLPALTKIAGQGQMNSHAFGFLTELSDDIGARVTGSPNDRKARSGGAAKMKSMGLDNVHLEKYQIWKGWTRGTADAEILTPVRHKLHVDAWLDRIDSSGGAEADIVRRESVRSGQRDQERRATQGQGGVDGDQRPAQQRRLGAICALR
jgi:hypothetical protein